MSWFSNTFGRLIQSISSIGLLFWLSALCSQAQEYKSIILPFDVNPNAENIQLVDGEFSIRSINAVGGGSGTTMFKVDQGLNKVSEVDFSGFISMRDSPQWHGNSYWAFAQSTIANDQYFILEMNTDFEILFVDTFRYQLDEGGGSTMTIKDNVPSSTKQKRPRN